MKMNSKHDNKPSKAGTSLPNCKFESYTYMQVNNYLPLVLHPNSKTSHPNSPFSAQVLQKRKILLVLYPFQQGACKDRWHRVNNLW